MISAPLIKNRADAIAYAEKCPTPLIIWGWISEAEPGLLVPNFTFVDQDEQPIGFYDIPPWFYMEIRGPGLQENTPILAQKSTALVHYSTGLIQVNLVRLDTHRKLTPTTQG